MQNTHSPVVMISGASGNLGQAVAHHFAQKGARLVLVARNRKALEAVAPEGDNVYYLQADLMQPEALQKGVDEAVKRFGCIDVLCNVAGGFHMGEPVHATPLAAWQQQYDMNVMTLLHTVQAVVPHMLQQGSGKVVNVGAFASRQGLADMGAYIAAKSAVSRITESMAAELREKGINVNCVLPTIIDTPQNREAMPDADPTRWVSPEKLAAVIAFLASEDASAIHGASVPVTGLS
ncbi:SDR family NAD(P)-dependent oxidoreductase [Alcaligenaceae bacterium 429]|nr:SDR family NAD(P)-dependent oxidoreductase [Alcaligenaceae bacterium 429]